ncbi:hypothetical protein CCP3SC15_1310005 [Gammaproteobacteria bacterium]
MAETTQVTGTAGAVVAPPIDPTLAQTIPTTEAAPETPVQPTYVTKEELDQIMAETLRRAKQSDRDRMKQIDEKLSAIKTRMEAGGAQLTASQVDVLRDQVEQSLEPTPVGQSLAPASALTPEMQAQVDYVYSQIDATFADVGTAVTPNDPEWKAIKEALDDPKGSLPKAIRAASKAAEAKAVRLAEQASGAAARVSSGGPQSPVTTSASSSHDLWSNAYKK